MDKWLALVSSIAPLIMILIPGGAGLAPLVPLIVHGIQEAEKFKGSGPEKKAHVQGVVADGIDTTNIVAGKVLLDPVSTLALSSTAIDTIVGVVNLLDRLNTPAVTAGPTEMP